MTEDKHLTITGAESNGDRISLEDTVRIQALLTKLIGDTEKNCQAVIALDRLINGRKDDMETASPPLKALVNNHQRVCEELNDHHILSRVDTMWARHEKEQNGKGVSHKFLWTTLGGTVGILVVVFGLLYNGLSSKVDGVDKEVERRAFIIESNTTMNAEQKEDIKKLQGDLETTRQHFRDHETDNSHNRSR